MSIKPFLMAPGFLWLLLIPAVLYGLFACARLFAYPSPAAARRAKRAALAPAVVGVVGVLLGTLEGSMLWVILAAAFDCVLAAAVIRGLAELGARRPLARPAVAAG